MSSLDRFRSPRSRAARHRAAVACGALVSLLVCGSAAGQFGPSIEVPPGPTVMPAVPLGGYPPTVAPTAVVEPNARAKPAVRDLEQLQQ